MKYLVMKYLLAILLLLATAGAQTVIGTRHRTVGVTTSVAPPQVVVIKSLVVIPAGIPVVIRH